MIVRMKRGVVLMSRETYIWDMIEAAKIAYSRVGKEVVITSGVDGTHSLRSKHYVGRALDFRTRHLSDSERVIVLDVMRQELGADYDCLDEGDHLHIEYDPKIGDV